MKQGVSESAKLQNKRNGNKKTSKPPGNWAIVKGIRAMQ